MDTETKKLAIRFQVAAEAEERANEVFFNQARSWLHSEDVDPQLRDLFLQRLKELIKSVSKSNRFIKRQMDTSSYLGT